MAMYTIAITPFIRSLEDEETKQVCFADDATTTSQHPNITKAEQLQIKRILVKAKKHQQSLVGAELKDKLLNRMQRVMNLSNKREFELAINIAYCRAWICTT